MSRQELFDQLALEGNYTLIFQYGLDNDPEIKIRKRYTCCNPTTAKDFKLQTELITKRKLRVDQIYGYAAEYGNIQLLDHLYEKETGFPSGCAFLVKKAVARSRWNVIFWIEEKGQHTWKESIAISIAARNGEFETVKWLHDHKWPIDSVATLFAVINNHFDIAKWLFENKCPLDKDCLPFAVRTGNKEMVEWLFKNGVMLTESCYIEAVNTKNTDMIEWLQDHKCPISSATLNTAVATLMTSVMKMWGKTILSNLQNNSHLQ